MLYEALDLCPICCSIKHKLEYDNVVDFFFQTSDVKFSFSKCDECTNIFLNPRPTAETIHEAYECYYTKDTKDTKDTIYSGWRNKFTAIAKYMGNSYSRHKYTHFSNISDFALYSIVSAMPPLKNRLDRRHRFGPKPSGPFLKVLDIGFGGGGFLDLAKERGWDVEGIEVDPEAIKSARSRGLKVSSSSLSKLVSMNKKYDFVTLSHVIEHVYNPREVLSDIFSLLKPNGVIWIETPNIDSDGRKFFGRFWRGLEAPRHLVLFSENSLRNLLKEIGFSYIENTNGPDVTMNIFSQSEKAQNTIESESDLVSVILKKFSILCSLLQLKKNKRKEFISLKAIKFIKN